jgi:exosome complex RNA-binding protein Rrp42 (RNase PH superfamily)
MIHMQLTIESYWTHRTRPDGRLFSQCRQLSITRSILRKTTYGSALLCVGSTRVVLAGVNLLVGRIVVPGGGGDVNVTVHSSSSSSMDTSIFQSWLERTLQETLDLQQLIIDGNSNQAFSLKIGLQLLSENVGNLRDVCLLAALAALQDIVLPDTTTETDKKNKIGTVYLKQHSQHDPRRHFKLPVVGIPLTLGLWRNTASGGDQKLEWIVDPTRDELDHGCCGHLTLVVDASSLRILQCDWVSVEAIDPTLLALAVQVAQRRAKDMNGEFDVVSAIG